MAVCGLASVRSGAARRGFRCQLNRVVLEPRSDFRLDTTVTRRLGNVKWKNTTKSLVYIQVIAALSELQLTREISNDTIYVIYMLLKKCHNQYSILN